MSAVELAAVVESWATVGGLLVLVLGGALAALQLRRDGELRRYQSTMAIMSDIRTEAVILSEMAIRDVPDGLRFDELDDDTRDAMIRVVTCYARLGQLAQAGAIKQPELFLNIGIATTAIALWEKVKHHVRLQEQQDSLRALTFVEYLAARAQEYIAAEGARRLGGIRRFDADVHLLDDVRYRISAARGASD